MQFVSKKQHDLSFPSSCTVTLFTPSVCWVSVSYWDFTLCPCLILCHTEETRTQTCKTCIEIQAHKSYTTGIFGVYPSLDHNCDLHWHKLDSALILTFSPVHLLLTLTSECAEYPQSSDLNLNIVKIDAVNLSTQAIPSSAMWFKHWTADIWMASKDKKIWKKKKKRNESHAEIQSWI